MKSLNTLVGSALLLLASAGAGMTNELLSFNQANPVNVKAIVLFGAHANRNISIQQSGISNSAAIVDSGAGGYHSIYQSGHSNLAIGGLLGSDQKLLLEQVQIGGGAFGFMGRQ